MGDSFEGYGAAKYFEDCVKTLERQKIEDELKRLSAACDAETELDKKRQLTRSILELTKQLKNF